MDIYNKLFPYGKTWLNTNTLIKRGQYSTVWSNTYFVLDGLIIL